MSDCEIKNYVNCFYLRDNNTGDILLKTEYIESKFLGTTEFFFIIFNSFGGIKTMN